MEYKVVSARNDLLENAKIKLATDVNLLLERGWKLQGGVSLQIEMHGYNATYVLAQALILEENSSPSKQTLQVNML